MGFPSGKGKLTSQKVLPRSDLEKRISSGEVPLDRLQQRLWDTYSRELLNYELSQSTFLMSSDSERLTGNVTAIPFWQDPIVLLSFDSTIQPLVKLGFEAITLLAADWDPTNEIDSIYANLAKQAAHNVKSNKVMLGKYMEDGVSYVQKAMYEKATYFYLRNWDKVSNALGEKNMWNINREFINQQWVAGKDFYFSHNPWEATGYFQKEVLHLIDLGVKEFIKAGDMWKAIR